VHFHKRINAHADGEIKKKFYTCIGNLKISRDHHTNASLLKQQINEMVDKSNLIFRSIKELAKKIQNVTKFIILAFKISNWGRVTFLALFDDYCSK
jgi:hypothetical protein